MQIEAGITRETKRSLDELEKAVYRLPRALMNSLRHTARLMREGVQSQLEGQLLQKRSGLLRSKVKGKAFQGKRSRRGSYYIAVGLSSKGRRGSEEKRSLPQWGAPAYGAFLATGGEKGGVIDSGDKWMALPLPGGPAMTRSGKRRYASPRDYPGKLRFIPSKHDPQSAVLVEVPKRAKRGRPRQGKVVFVLKKRVYIQPRDWMTKAVESRMPPLQDRVARIIDSVIKSAP